MKEPFVYWIGTWLVITSSWKWNGHRNIPGSLAYRPFPNRKHPVFFSINFKMPKKPPRFVSNKFIPVSTMTETEVPTWPVVLSSYSTTMWILFVNGHSILSKSDTWYRFWLLSLDPTWYNLFYVFFFRDRLDRLSPNDVVNSSTVYANKSGIDRPEKSSDYLVKPFHITYGIPSQGSPYQINLNNPKSLKTPVLILFPYLFLRDPILFDFNFMLNSISPFNKCIYLLKKKKYTNSVYV